MKRKLYLLVVVTSLAAFVGYTQANADFIASSKTPTISEYTQEFEIVVLCKAANERKGHAGVPMQ